MYFDICINLSLTNIAPIKSTIYFGLKLNSLQKWLVSDIYCILQIKLLKHWYNKYAHVFLDIALFTQSFLKAEKWNILPILYSFFATTQNQKVILKYIMLGNGCFWHKYWIASQSQQLNNNITFNHMYFWKVKAIDIFNIIRKKYILNLSCISNILIINISSLQILSLVFDK